MKNKQTKLIILNIAVVMVLALGVHLISQASDHDDGEMDLKGRALNLTDLHVFREDWQDSSASSNNLIMIMSTNPRSMARQQYSFSTQARYEFRASRVSAANKSQKPTGADDVLIGFEFGAPKSNGRQNITMTLIKDGSTRQFAAGETTTLADQNANIKVVNPVSVDGQSLAVFAGLREDAFFFDVERYFRVRGLLATGTNTLTGPTQPAPNPFRSNATAVDFTAGYNVNAIVLRVPIALLQSSAGEPVFDVWETISIKQ